MKRQTDPLGARCDLGDRPALGVTTSRGKSASEVSSPTSFSPCRIRTIPRRYGLPPLQIAEVKKQTGRDLTRLDLDFDLPDRFYRSSPPPST
jgi:hypothetical protein